MTKKEQGKRGNVFRVWKNGAVVEVIRRVMAVVGPEGPDVPIVDFDKNGQPIVKPSETGTENKTSGIDRSVPNGDR